MSEAAKKPKKKRLFLFLVEDEETRIRIVTEQPCLYIQKYSRDCVFDLCELEGAKPILCEAIEAYVNECQDRGVNIGPWRNETFCRKC